MIALLNRLRNEPALILGFTQAVLGLLLAFGVDLSSKQTAAVLAVTAAGLALAARAKVVPTRKLDPDLFSVSGPKKP
jgi:hypothetical protein